jgi:hypothetical protein
MNKIDSLVARRLGPGPHEDYSHMIRSKNINIILEIFNK